jgi:hypothetical protein
MEPQNKKLTTMLLIENVTVEAWRTREIVSPCSIRIGSDTLSFPLMLSQKSSDPLSVQFCRDAQQTHQLSQETDPGYPANCTPNIGGIKNDKGALHGNGGTYLKQPNRSPFESKPITVGLSNLLCHSKRKRIALRRRAHHLDCKGKIGTRD